MNDNLETYLSAALQRLEKAAETLIKSGGFTRDAHAVKVLTELLKEQVQDENSGTAARQAG